VIPAVTTGQILALGEACRGVFVDPMLVQHAVRLSTATRNPEEFKLSEMARYITWGASPRASIYLIVAAKTLAFVRGRAYVVPQDITDLVHDVMRHRIILSYEALADGVSADDILDKVTEAVPAPPQALKSHAAAGA
jgi:MoxR-like ATPase